MDAINDEGRGVGNGDEVWGLCIGPGYVSHAVIDYRRHWVASLGTYRFEMPRDRKGRSLAAARRAARSARRTKDRRRTRKGKVIELLSGAGLMPADAGPRWFSSRKGDRNVLMLRAVGLDERLSDRELARVLYALAGRRGFEDSGAAEPCEGSKSQVERRKMLSAMYDNDRRMAEGGYRTVGEMLWREGDGQGRCRNRDGAYTYCVRAGQVRDEVEALCASQRALGCASASEALVEEYLAVVGWHKGSAERDVASYVSVGRCTYHPEEKRAARADLSNELVCAHESLCNLVVVDERGTERRLDRVTRDCVMSTLFSASPGRMTYSDLRALLNLGPQEYFKGVARRDEARREPASPRSWRVVCDTLGEGSRLVGRMAGDRRLADVVMEALTYASSEDVLLSRVSELLEDAGLGQLCEEELAELLSLPFASVAFKSYARRGLGALGSLLEAFEDGASSLAEAEETTGLLDARLSAQKGSSELLEPYEDYDPTCTNPVVMRALSCARRVTNALIRERGLPDAIHVWLDRDLTMSEKDRERVAKAQARRRRQHAKESEEISRMLGIPKELVTPGQLRIYDHHAEQGGVDAYTGEAIDLTRALTDESYVETNHVLPYCRSLEGGWDNLVLVLKATSQRKGARTPYEWMEDGGEGVPSWDDYVRRVRAMRLRDRKEANLLHEGIGAPALDPVLEGNVADGRYMARALRGWLGTLGFPDDGREHVTAFSKAAVGVCRRAWNLGVPETERAVGAMREVSDAVTLAACSVGTVRRVLGARASGLPADVEGTQPWPGFAAHAAARRRMVIPTRKVSKRGRGKVTEDTLYHIVGRTESGMYLVTGGSASRPVPKGNVHVLGDGTSLKMIGDQACLRVWHDPAAGRYYLEPLFHYDIPDIARGRHVPMMYQSHRPREERRPIPASALGECLVLHRGDVVIVNGQVGRYVTYSVSSAAPEFSSLVDGTRIKLASPTRWHDVRVVNEDCLGRCYDGHCVDEDERLVERERSDVQADDA